MGKILHQFILLAAVALFAAVNTSSAGPLTTFKGTNAPGASRDFSFTIGAGVTNLALTLPGSATTYSFLYLKKGSGASETNYNWAAQFGGGTNSISLETPPSLMTNWSLRVATPAESATHAFSVAVATNSPALRQVRAISKPLNFTTAGVVAFSNWNYFRVDVPTNATSLRISIFGATNVMPDVHVQSGRLPTAASALKKSVSVLNDALYFSDVELAPGPYFIGISSPIQTNHYTLKSETLVVRQLNFDAGLTHEGTDIFTNQTTAATNFYFKIRTINPSVGAWRTALKVLSGEANLYMMRGTIPTPTANSFKSERAGSDGVVLGPGQFAAGEDWYILVKAGTNTNWRIVSGAAHVVDLGELATNALSSTNVFIGPEGWRFFKTVVPQETLAWRLSLNGATNMIYLKKTSVPLSSGSEMSQPSRMLVVPPYLSPGQLYFIGVPGTNGARVDLDSRQQPVTDLNFVTNSVLVTNGHFATYRIQVPPNEIIWQVNLVPASGNPNLYLRRNFVPNENYNDAYSEAAGLVTDSITLAPPTLADGTFFLTVASTNTSSFRVQTGPPTVTDINFVGQPLNTETNRVGWRYFRVLSLDQQTNSLGWDLSLSNAAPGTRIALRSSQAPSSWSSRNGATPGTVNSYDLISQGTFLQQPGHEVDVWYVGVYNPSNALGAFRLITKSLTAQLITNDNVKIFKTNAAKSKWEFFRVDIPAGIQGWDIRLTNIVGGAPRIAIRREALPTTSIANGLQTTTIATTLSSPSTATNWPGGMQWAPLKDWTARPQGTNGLSEEGRIAAMGMGRPLEPGTYYVGVFNAGTNASTYGIWNRFIGAGRSIGVPNLAYGGGITNGVISPREAAYFKVSIASNMPSWKVRLDVTNGEAMLVVSTNRIPNLESEKRMQKLGREQYLLLPDKGQRTLRAGDYYLAVVGEGTNASSSKIGAGLSSYTLQSIGRMPTNNMGLLNTNDLVTLTNSLEGGASMMFHFSTVSNLLGFETTLESKVGNPVQVSRGTWELPDPGVNGDAYGNQGGETDALVTSPFKIYVADPFPNETIAVKARASSGLYPDARFVLRVKRIVPSDLTFHNGTRAVTNQIATTWRFFKVNVPTNALGWDIRLTNVVAGNPRMVVAHGALPIELSTAGFSPGSSDDWPLWGRWAAGKDWTERSFSANGAINTDGRILAMGMGRPLEAGTYYVGVYCTAATNSYTVMSRGIGAGFSIPVRDLSFNGGTTNGTLQGREAAYYRVAIPGGMLSWKLQLTQPTNSEAALLVLKEALPNVLASGSLTVTAPLSSGRKMQKVGPEQFLLLPQPGQTTLTPGNYYIAVAAEGTNITNSARIGTGQSSYTLTSLGQMPFINLETLTSNLTATGAVSAAECIGYKFTVPRGVVSLEARLESRIGNPVMVMRAGPRLPDPGMSGNGIPGDTYGNEGGESSGTSVSPNLISVANPTNGTFYIIVKARQTNNVYTNASFVLRLNAVGTTQLDFESSVSVTNQQHGTWRYFRVDVPETTLGWDLRLTNVNSGSPRIVVRRDALPSALTTLGWGSPGSQTNWASSNQWAAAGDWTRRQYSPNGATDENGRILAMGMGRPLEPGSYYVGIANGTGSSPMTYTLMSRGIGEGFSIPVIDLPFTNGTVTNLSILPREAAYFRVVVPGDTPSWKVRVTGLSGEVMLVALKNFVPNVEYLDPNRSITLGRSMQKAGNEHFLLLPSPSQTNLPASTNFFAIIGEGANTTNSQRIGVGDSGFVLTSLGSLPVNHLGTVSETDLEQSDSLAAGECKAYQFTVPPGIFGVEAKLENRIGNPVMVVRFTNSLPDAGGSFGSVLAEPYGNEGGLSPSDANASLLTIPNSAAGIYSLIVKARGANGVFSDASYRLRIRQIVPATLNFGSHLNTNGFSNVVSGVLETNQRVFYRVEVPFTFNGSNVLGWKLEATHAYGLSAIRVRKDFLPSDNPAAGTPFVSPAAYLVPPLITNGTWYVELKGQNSTAFTLTSSPLELERPLWIMPGPGETNSTPGVTLPTFADTGVRTNGTKITNYAGEFLEQGYNHYYGIVIPTNNLGLLRVELKAISGNPDLYVRTNFAPTISHSSGGGNGTIFDRSMLATGTEFANWVPLDGKLETKMKSGLWYFAVISKNANTRYQLVLSTGNIQNVSIASTSLTNQSVNNGDWRYYRFQMPTAIPTGWRINFAQQSGDVWLYVRDTVPPGVGTTATEFKSWTTDIKNNGSTYGDFNAAGQYDFTTPPSRPGQIYYVGVRGLSDAQFTLSISTNGAPVVEPIAINFYGGNVSTNLPAFSQARYRIDVPSDAARWKHSATHPSTVLLYLEQGTLPSGATTDDWRSIGANATLNQFLLNANPWPWVPGQSYFLTVTNSAATAAPFAITLDGRNKETDDDDNDSLPDAWERQYFGNTGQQPHADFDGDGRTNLEEYQNGTNPADPFNSSLSVFRKMKSPLLVAPGLDIRSPVLLPNGACQFTIHGAPGLACVIEVSSDLLAWTPLLSLTTDANGNALVTDAPNNVSQRFYRVRKE